jgi:hypothetical protein
VRLTSLLASAAVAAAVVAVAPAARADASAWFFVGGGTTAWKQARLKLVPEGSMAFDVGIGTTPNAPFIVGGLFRLQPIWNGGADVSLMLRGATHGFQAGSFGIALDAGVYERPWWTGSRGFAGDLTLGAPFGLQLTVGGQVGSDSSLGIMAFAGIDLLRLTLYRQVGLGVWPNPSSPHQDRAKFGAFFF